MKNENPFEIAMSGLAIKDWIWQHSQYKNKYTRLANSMSEFFNLNNEKYYMLALCHKKPIAIEVPEKGKKYEVPCDD